MHGLRNHFHNNFQIMSHKNALYPQLLSNLYQLEGGSCMVILAPQTLSSIVLEYIKPLWNLDEAHINGSHRCQARALSSEHLNKGTLFVSVIILLHPYIT